VTQEASHSELDATLPPELRELLPYGGPLEVEKAVAANPEEVESQRQPEATTMATNENTPKILTTDEVKAIASQSVAEIQGQKDREQALATKIAGFVEKTNEANQSLLTARTELATATDKVTKLEKEVSDVKAEAAKAKDDKKKADDEKDNIIKQYNKAKADLDEASKKLAKIEAEKSLASRKDKLKTKGLKAESKFGMKATATKEDGSLEMSDETFEERLAEFEEVVSAEAAKAPPVKKDKNDDSENDGGKAPNKGKANAEQANATTTATQTPAEPDLGKADAIAQATAALLSGGETQNADRVGMFAAVFGTGI
jgi:hypothetical protein